MNPKTLLGKVFISYSSRDKTFVRKLANEIEKRGYLTWLDEKEIVAGDYLPKKIGEAIETSKVIIVVLSKNSISSRWVQYEINNALQRMIKGKVRLIPVLIDDVDLPPELNGLVYVDFRESFDNGLEKILAALEYEASKYDLRKIFKNVTFLESIEDILEKTFDSKGFSLITGEYKSTDFKFVTLGETEIGYEIIPSYGDKRALSERWWDEFSEVISDYGVPYFLLITQRPVGFKVTQSYEKGKIMLKDAPSVILGVDTTKVIIIDLSDVVNTEKYSSLIEKAKELIEFFTKQNGVNSG